MTKMTYEEWRELGRRFCVPEGTPPWRRQMIASRAAFDLVMQEHARACTKYPTFATSTEQGFAVLQREAGELADAIIKGDLDGPHGVIREAAQVAAVAIRIMEMAEAIMQDRAALAASAKMIPPCNCGQCMACRAEDSA